MLAIYYIGLVAYRLLCRLHDVISSVDPNDLD